MTLKTNTKDALELNQTRIKMLYEHNVKGEVSYYAWLVGLSLLLYLNGLSTLYIIIWFVFVTIPHLIKAYILIPKLKNQSTIKQPLKWENYIAIALLFEATTASITVMSIIDFNQPQLAFAAIYLVAMPAYASISVLISSLKSYYAWVFGLLIPTSLACFLSDDLVFWVIGVMIIIAGLTVTIRSGKQLTDDFLDTLRLRFENEKLLKEVIIERNNAEKSNKEKTQFLASASHDLRQPLHALALFCDALDNDLSEPNHVKIMSKIKESSSSVNSLLNSLLDISRLDANVIKVNKNCISANDLIQKMIDVMQLQADKKDIAINYNNSNFGVYSDAILLESILSNLINNAIKYTESGSIDINCKAVNDKIEITISDTGVGISDENILAIFDDFYQVNNPERDRRKGLGLGLAIVKRTCALLGHDITVTSNVNKGSSFTLTLDKATASKIQSITADDNELLVNNTSATVLVIDDDINILMGTKALLTKWGYNVICAESYDDAIKNTPLDNNVDLIISDYRLRENQLGTDVIKQLMQYYKNPSIPAIIVTGDTGTKQIRDVTEAGFSVLYKPVVPIQMRALIQNLLKKQLTVK